MRTNRSSNRPRNHDKDLARAASPTGPKRIGPKELRIIGGQLKRRKVIYNGDRATRPMKDSVRENLFNILGRAIEESVAWDLFAGTGILAIEAISRGAAHAIALDSSRDCIRSIRRSADALGVGDRVETLLGDTFRLANMRLKHSAGERRVVFCCPPYALWDSHHGPLSELLSASMTGADRGSLIVAETDRRFDTATLPPAEWDIRTYGNTTLAIAEVG